MGIWRTIRALDRHGIRASALRNSDVVAEHPQILAADVERDWAWLAHGRTRAALHTGLAADEERRTLADVARTIADATGRQPRGWMGPGPTETHNTPKLLADLGYHYVLDWTNDDHSAIRRPFPGCPACPVWWNSATC